MSHHAAALTYYSLLALFPALLLLVAILGIFGEQKLIGEAASYLRTVGAPKETVTTITAGLRSALSQDGSALGALTVGLATSLWGASAAFGAAGTALNVVLRLEEGRNALRRKAGELAMSGLLLTLVLLTFLLVFLGGDLASLVFGLLGWGPLVEGVWRVVRWPGAIACVMVVYAVTFSTAPDIPERKLRWISAGAVVGVLAWLTVSGLFFAYVAVFASFSAVYGTFSAIVMLLIWLWLTNVALLLGAELNAVVDARRGGPDSRAEVSRALRTADSSPD